MGVLIGAQKHVNCFDQGSVQFFPIFFWTSPFFWQTNFYRPHTMPSTHMNTIFSYSIFGMFENDRNKNERKDAFHYKT